MRISTWIHTHGVDRFQSVPASSEHRLLWGWIRLGLGVTQIGFALAAAYAWASEGLHWRAGVATLTASIAALASWFLYAGRRDPRIEGSRMGIGSKEQDD